MTHLSRRGLVKMATGLAVVAVALPQLGAGAEPFDLSGRPTDPAAEDVALLRAIQHPFSYMLTDQVTVKLDGDRRGHEFVIRSARDEKQRPTKIYMLSGKMRIFLADPDQDEFTKNGGLYWSFAGKKGKTQLKKPGAIVMAVRDTEDTVRFYTLRIDLRC